MEGLDPLKIGEAIKIKRIQKRITQTHMAELLGISQTHLSNAESGRVMLSLKIFFRVRDILGCTLSELLEPDSYVDPAKRRDKHKRYSLVRCDD
ncbi:MAG: helix-turn-helix domain-containing protein [Phascolarctobacterium sp.]|uniref:helix-turn-helix domain-containing protein n=1 Tax=Phascolarctobacterium sp. TaxID=2049039 RepID=UPI0025D38416|nr:helix-turn-helix transcriptional regulator [Phascolarctobacterium sp.]MCC8159647.1 helix-turn-helix domain-containing protein [Phascolarctobacterium sp.]